MWAVREFRALQRPATLLLELGGRSAIRGSRRALVLLPAALIGATAVSMFNQLDDGPPCADPAPALQARAGAIPDAQSVGERAREVETTRKGLGCPGDKMPAVGQQHFSLERQEADAFGLQSTPSPPAAYGRTSDIPNPFSTGGSP